MVIFKQFFLLNFHCCALSKDRGVQKPRRTKKISGFQEIDRKSCEKKILKAALRPHSGNLAKFLQRQDLKHALSKVADKCYFRENSANYPTKMTKTHSQ